MKNPDEQGEDLSEKQKDFIEKISLLCDEYGYSWGYTVDEYGVSVQIDE